MIRIFTSPSQGRGEEGEHIAAAWLKKKGYTILGRNSSGKYGEIDIIGKKGNMYYFFEVKSGREGAIVAPSENFSAAKLQKVLTTASYYAATNRIENYRVMGVVVVFLEKGGSSVDLLELW